jgi:hypothetical protein
MFCPNCASQNPDQTNYCRNCGLDLKNLAMVLNSQLAMPREASNAQEKRIELTQQWLKLQSDGRKSAIQGALLVVTGGLLGWILAEFTRGDVQENWAIIWLIFCGWLPVWGTLLFGEGISNFMQSRLIRRYIDSLVNSLTPLTSAIIAETRETPQTKVISEVPIASSVTEHTTSPLIKPQA